MRLSRVVAAVALPAVLLLSGCHAAPDASTPTTGTSADPLSDVESTVDAVQHDLDSDSDS